jgi:hypothetical protein
VGLLEEEDIYIMEQEEEDDLYQVEGFLDLLWGSCSTCSPSPLIVHTLILFLSSLYHTPSKNLPSR